MQLTITAQKLGKNRRFLTSKFETFLTFYWRYFDWEKSAEEIDRWFYQSSVIGFRSHETCARPFYTRTVPPKLRSFLYYLYGFAV